MARERQQEQRRRHWRLLLPICLFVLGIGALLSRVYWVQIVLGDESLERTRRQSIRVLVKNPVRGQIRSRDGVILAGNRCHYDLTMHPSQMRQLRGYLWTSTYMLNTATYIEQHLVRRPAKISIVSLRKRMKQDMAQPIVLYQDLTDEEIARVTEHTPPIQGVEITPRIERDYPSPSLASHVLGYVGWRWRSTPAKNLPSQKTFRSKELLGNSGLERKFDDDLSGHPGAKMVLVDPVGFVRRELPGATEPVDGFDLTLTLDSRAQRAAENALRGLNGALVALDCRSGAVIAMASAPTYDLGNLNAKYYAELTQDKENTPLFHRALAGKYMPGSIIKPLIALAALESDPSAGEHSFNCLGKYQLGNRRIKCARQNGHGMLQLKRAIAVSCNPYFIDSGIGLGLQHLEAMYKAAGVGQKCGFDLPETQVGTCPSQETAQRILHRRWIRSDTAYVSIGQGLIELTPLQAAVFTAALANGGDILRPFIVWRTYQKDGALVRETHPRIRNRLPASTAHLALVREAMIEAVEGKGVSAAAMKRAGIPLAAKTGTAEVGPPDNRYKNTWIICYGPLPNPTFAVACIIEHGDSGGRTTAPVVVSFLRHWLNIHDAFDHELDESGIDD
ncbi:MAG: penicillin-binding protein 2 [Victivallales bacterium]|nr:penicillin-binding protein 2 [Victivallales bacterium]